MNDLRETMARQRWMASASPVGSFFRRTPRFRKWTTERYGFRLTIAEHPWVQGDCVWCEHHYSGVHALGSPQLVTELRFDDWMRRIRGR